MTEFHLVVWYQHEENYGAHDWDGEGECPQYWKMKGGHDEIVATLTTAEVVEAGASGLEALVNDLSTVVDTESFRQYPRGYELVTIDTDLLVRVRDALAEAIEDFGRDDPFLFMAVAVELRESEAAVKLAMAKLEDPNLVLPVVEDEADAWEDYDLAA